MDATCSSETSVYNKSTRRHIPEDGILHLFPYLQFIFQCSPLKLYTIKWSDELERIYRVRQANFLFYTNILAVPGHASMWLSVAEFEMKGKRKRTCMMCLMSQCLLVYNILCCTIVCEYVLRWDILCLCRSFADARCSSLWFARTHRNASVLRVQRPKLDLLRGIILMNPRWSRKEWRFYVSSQFFCWRY
jgi:hypothetical protein